MKRCKAFIFFAPVTISAYGRELRDIKPPRPVFSGLVSLIALFLFALILGGLYLFLRRRIRAYKKELPGPAPEPAVSAAARAYQRLERLRVRNLVAAGKFREYFLELNDIVRQYLEGWLGQTVYEKTSEEFLRDLTGRGDIADHQKFLLGDFLEKCDLVKFAAAFPSEEECELAAAAALRLIDETAPRETKEETETK